MILANPFSEEGKVGASIQFYFNIWLQKFKYFAEKMTYSESRDHVL